MDNHEVNHARPASSRITLLHRFELILNLSLSIGELGVKEWSARISNSLDIH